MLRHRKWDNVMFAKCTGMHNDIVQFHIVRSICKNGDDFLRWRQGIG